MDEATFSCVNARQWKDFHDGQQQPAVKGCSTAGGILRWASLLSGPCNGKNSQSVKEPGMRVTATEAKNRFGSLCAQAKSEPVFVEKPGQIDTMILSAEQYQALQANHYKASRAARKKAFEAEFGDWIAAQNVRFETHGIPGAELRPG
jgi:PHD/YefM family antitoxin component YafN of YafNO toxin-antitoxin module